MKFFYLGKLIIFAIALVLLCSCNSHERRLVCFVLPDDTFNSSAVEKFEELDQGFLNSVETQDLKSVMKYARERKLYFLKTERQEKPTCLDGPEIFDVTRVHIRSSIQTEEVIIVTFYSDNNRLKAVTISPGINPRLKF